jgi:hypothetical protein
MSDIRITFLEAGRVAADLLGRPEVAARWDGPSRLEHFSMWGLAGHLVRAVGSVEIYLDRDEPSDDEPGVDATGYYRAALGAGGPVDLGSDLHVAVRQRGEETAAEGYDALRADLDGLLARLGERLRFEPRTRRIRVLHGLVLPLDDYLITRIIELLVHTDDLAVSADLTPPEPPPEAAGVAIAMLVDLACLRHGDLAVLRALTRRERAPEGVLNVL